MNNDAPEIIRIIYRSPYVNILNAAIIAFNVAAVAALHDAHPIFLIAGAPLAVFHAMVL